MVDILSSSEFIQINRNMPGPDIPIPLTKHTMINVKDDVTLLVGGHAVNLCSPKTYSFNHKERKWSNRADLNQGRLEHAIGIVIDEVTIETLVVVTGGRCGIRTFRSTEILLDDTWKSGDDKLVYYRYWTQLDHDMT